MSTLVALVVELPLCFLVFYPSWEGRLLVFVANAGLMAMINLTGAYPACACVSLCVLCVCVCVVCCVCVCVYVCVV
jgi:hypothetical protein